MNSEPTSTPTPTPTPTPTAASPDAATAEPSPCPYCGTPIGPDSGRCLACKGLLDPLSRQATQNAMGPWFIRDGEQPFRPGCSYDTLLALIRRGRIDPATVLRGPTTGQFWRPARHVPGIGHLFGRCHACDHGVSPDAASCPRCRASFATPRDRQDLGLGPVHPLPGQPATQPAAGAVRRDLRGPQVDRQRSTASISGPRPVPGGVVAPANPATSGTASKVAGPAAALATMAAGSGGPAASRRRVASPSRPNIAPSAASASPGRKQRPSTFAFVLAAVSLLLAVAVVMAAVFRTELTDLFYGETATPASTSSSRYQDAPQPTDPPQSGDESAEDPEAAGDGP